MAELYTDDPIRKMLETARAADSSAYRASVATPYPNSPLPPNAMPEPPKPPPGGGAAPPIAPTTTPPIAPQPVAPQPAKPGMMSRAASGVGKLLSLPGAAAIGGVAGAVGSVRDAGSGYRDQFNASVGAETPMQTLGADALRTMGNVGNTLTGGIAGKLGQGISSVVNGGSFGDGFSQTSARDAFYEKQGPITNASKASQRVADIAQKNPELFPGAAQPAGVTQAPTSAAGVTQLTGGQFKSPMFTDNPARAADEYGSKKNSLFSVVPSTAEADRSYLQGAFNQHINSGDLDRAAATAVTPQDRAALGIAYNQRQQAQAQAAQTEPIQRMLMESLNKSPREQRLSEDVRTRAFSGVSGPRGGQPAAGGGQGDIQAMLQQMLASQKGGQPQQSAMAQAMAQAAGQQAADTNVEGQKIAQAGSKITQQGQLQMQQLQQQIMNEKDPAKLTALQEKYQTLTGKYEKAAPAQKAVIEDFDTGQKDAMGQAIFKKRAINPETGEPITKAPAADKTTRAQERARADRAIAAKGSNKAAIEADFNAKMKALGL